MSRRSLRLGVLVAVGCVLLVAGVLLSLFWATDALSFADALSVITGAESSPAFRAILLGVRVPRTVAALVCGCAFSVSGFLLQTSLNNSLASPGVLGVNSGAGFFVLLSTLLVPYSSYVRTASSFAGAALAMLIVCAVSLGASLSRTSLVLAGVAVSSLFTAGIDVLITFYPEVVADKVAFSLGGFSSVSPRQVRVASCVVAVCLAVALLLSRGIDLFALGDEAAFALGLNVRRHRLCAVTVASLLAAAGVSVSGLLSFVGLIVPNVVRMAGRYSARQSICLCALWGGSFLLLCDFFARTLFFPYEVPVGLFLSCLGSPFFIVLLARRRHRLDA